MAKKSGGSTLSKLVAFVAWLTGVIVALAVGFSLASSSGALAQTFPSYLGGATVAMVAGWIVIILTLISILLTMIDKAG